MVDRHDHTRFNLVTRFKCAQCGEMLKLTNKEQTGYDLTPDEPTGMEMVGVTIGVYPCEKCLAPLGEMKRAVRILLDVKEK